MEEFLDNLLSQIRCKKARPFISDEIKLHIEEQISENINSGMNREEAEREAIKDMGDPIEVGISLDRIHKPQVAWRMLGVIALISILGIILQFSISLQIEKFDIATNNGSSGFAISVLLGLAVMFILYLMDYTTIGKYAKVIGGLMIIATLYTSLFGSTIAGRIFYIGLGPLRVQLTAFMMFYIPIYGAIIYKYRGGGLGAFLKVLMWMVVPVILAFNLPSLMLAAVMLISMLVQLTIALVKGWFKLPIKRTIILMWVIALVLPIVSIYGMYSSNLLLDNQMASLCEFFLAGEEVSWLTGTLRGLANDIAIVGNSGKELIGYLPDFNRDYIFSYVLNTYGRLAGILLVMMLTALVLSIFSTAIKQKNQLGYVMGCGCGMIFLMNIIINLLGSMGVIPPTSSFLPFFSAGGSNIILSYALVGITLSIYRYKSVYPQHVSTKLTQIKRNMTIDL